MQSLLFDLDGTLLDHFTCLARCYEHVLGELDQPRIDKLPIDPTSAVITDDDRKNLCREPQFILSGRAGSHLNNVLLISRLLRDDGNPALRLRFVNRTIKRARRPMITMLLRKFNDLIKIKIVND